MLTFGQWLNESLEWKETRYDINDVQYKLVHETPVTPHHTLVIAHLITRGKKGNYLSTDFGFSDPKSDYPEDIITQAQNLNNPLPREHVIKTMATVSKSVHDVMRDHNIYQAEFYANSERKNKTYAAAAQRISTRLGGKHNSRDDMQYITMPQNKKANK